MKSPSIATQKLDIRRLYENIERKDADYYGHIRKEIVSLVEGKNLKVLEIGCGEGNTLRYLKDKKIAKEVVGIELNKEVAKKAQKNLDKAFSANIEEFEIPYKKYFDYIILADVLEHMIDPWSVLKRVKEALKDDGRIIISIPNLRHIKIIKELLVDGDWKQHTNSDRTDKTHMRFFTWKTLHDMVTQAGFSIELRTANQATKLKYKVFDMLTLNRLADLKVSQFIIRIKKTKT